MDVLAIVYIISGALILWHLLIYPIVMGIIALIKKPLEKDYSYLPKFSIIVPAYNEEKVIINRIKNLEALNYPKDRYEIIIVESGSTDNTYMKVEEYIKSRKSKFPIIKLLHEAKRKGKPSAVNYGKKYSDGEIILVTDANSIFDKNVLKELAPHFKDPKVGAVGGRFVPIKNNSQGEGVDFYWDWEFLMRLGESQLYSTCVMHGEINAWRKELVELNPNLISDDLMIPLEVISKGKLVKYEPNAVVYEKVPSTKVDEIKQRKKNAIGTIQVTFKYIKFLLSPRLYSLIYFSHKGLQIFFPYLIVSFALPLLVGLAKKNSNVLYLLALYSILSIVSLFILMIIIQKVKVTYDIGAQTNNAKASSLIIKLPAIVIYFLWLQWIVVLAWFDYLRGRYSVKWQKAESTR
ncbi:glycosyltransferase [Thermococcus pacificus]|uniref:Glycosyltransferase 2-like domain-containing protein n=1 Tax=Thermococcus pacificus TaxID=71998 RepID=A0A218P6I8_9EURY|nr:glycosyltransferase [Thermococcus pacificus]ASJ06392.1 hypothetical protein A3L08_03110 [Thermococcus pacificus]